MSTELCIIGSPERCADCPVAKEDSFPQKQIDIVGYYVYGAGAFQAGHMETYDMTDGLSDQAIACASIRARNELQVRFHNEAS